MLRRNFLKTLLLASLVPATSVSVGYPLDGFDDTGIRRLEFYRLGQQGIIKNVRKLPPGGMLASDEIQLNYPNLVDGQLPLSDASFSQKLLELLPEEDRDRYSIAILDYTRAETPVFATLNGDQPTNVGSVGKLVAGLALYQQLANIYPGNVGARKNILRSTNVTADKYAIRDHHKVPFFDIDSRRLSHRALVPGDRASLWEYLDFMYSASSNSAASMVIQQALLLSQYGASYPASDTEHMLWLEKLGWAEEGEKMRSVMLDALTVNGIDTESFRQLSYFTRQGKQESAGGKSVATATSLVHFLARMERGELIDAWSSLEMKKQLFMTQKRIRYASHPAMGKDAIYFKSGSLYSCKPEPGFVCRKYRGNRKNILASVAIIESPPLFANVSNPQQKIANVRYAVAVISNVLYKNSAIAHQQLAYKIHKLVERRHQENPEIIE